jgi:C4-dicarboxylate-specific signal transduction histidine kinase
MTIKEKKYKSLKKKLLFTIILVSTVISTFMTCIQYYREYSNKLYDLNQKILDLTESSKASLTRSLWNLDKQQLIIQINSMLKVDDIVKIKIIGEDDHIYYESMKKDSELKSKFSLKTELRLDKETIKRTIGTIEIFATEENIKSEILENLIIFLISQFIKTIFTSMIVLLILRFYLTKHLFDITNFMKYFNFNSSKENKLKLDRTVSYRDEIDDLEDSINIFISKLSEANREKNQRIIEQEKEIQLQKAASINQARLASLGEMAANIAHEINNPLTVLSFSGKKLEQLSRDKDVNPDRLLHFSNMINRTVSRMSKTVRGLKKLGRDAKQDEMKDVKISELIENVLDLCQVSVANKGINISTSFHNTGLESKIHCREVQITQILVNLLNNSVDEVKDMHQPWVTIKTEFKEDKCHLSVEDCGAGIPTDIEDRIFEPFFTTKDVGEGTGLGLSISARMAREHEGRLFVDRSVKHTKMTLELPREINQ